MSIHIPSEVVFFLNALGIPYPDVDVDQVRELSQNVRDFAFDIRGTFDEATGTLQDLGSSMSGNSYQAILVVWSGKSGKMNELEAALEFVADALDVAAEVIEAVQIAVLIELAALAAAFIASMFTPAAPATGPALATAARQIAKALAEFVIGYFAGEILMKAFEPLLQRFDEFIRDTLLPPGTVIPGSDSAGEVSLDPAEVERYISKLESYAQDMASHGDKFNEKLDVLDFATPGLEVTPAEWPSPTAPPPVDTGQPGQLPNSLPNSLPGADKPGPETRVENPRENVSAPTGDQEAGKGNTPPAAASSGTDTGRPESVPSGEPSAAGAPTTGSPGGIGQSAGIQSAGVGSDRLDVHAAEGGSNTTGADAHSTDGGESGSEQHSAGQTTGAVPPVAAQSTTSAPAQSQQSTSSGSQRSGDAAANKAQGSAAGGKAQGGAGRAAASSGAGGQQQPSRQTAKTPWSRGGGKAARVAPGTKHPAETVPAVSAGEAGKGSEEVQTTQPVSSAGATGPQVFAPETATPPASVVPPAASSSDEAAAPDRAVEVIAEPAPKEADPSAVGGRPQAG